MGVLNVFRGIVYVLVAFFSIVVLAFTIFDETPSTSGPNPFDNLSLAAAVITLVFIVLTLLLEGTVRSGVTSLVPIEVARIGVLWSLWVASGAKWYAVIPYSKSAPLCGEVAEFDELDALWEGECAESIIVPACSMVNFFLLFVWFILLVIFASVNHHWRSQVHRVNLTRKKGSEPEDTGKLFVHYQQPPQPYYWNPSQQPPGSGSGPQQFVTYGPGYQGPGFPQQPQHAYQGPAHSPPQAYTPYSVNDQPVSPPTTEGQQQATPRHSPPTVDHPRNAPAIAIHEPSTDEKA